MASQTFEFTNGSGGESSAVTVSAGESVRVRFSTRHGTFKTQLRISANSVDSFITVNETEAWVTGAVIEGDEVSLIASLDDGADACAGIIETFT